MKAEKKRKQKKRGEAMAPRADRHDLYQRAVQDPESDIDFLERVWREAYGDADEPRHFREDFCGTALLCGEWVARGPERTAEGYDIDGTTLAWGLERNITPRGEAADRVALHELDVREPGERLADIRCAHNFSYQIFRERAVLLDYLRKVRAGLSERSVFVMDLFGGSEAIEELEEERDIEDGAFTYVWEQRSFHPATSHTECYIHFRMPDGSALREAFHYSWRLYTPPELRDLV